MIVKGRIHSYESFGTLDGPGIRFVVFMQGCPLHCIYCHNRDTWDVGAGNIRTVDEVMAELNKYKSYFAFSGGGITVSGGEPLLQHEFVTALFERCKAEGIHTTLDTSGFTRISSDETDSSDFTRISSDETSSSGFTASISDETDSSGFTASISDETDSSGFTASIKMKEIDRLLSVTDLVLLDIKHATETGHKQITGVGRKKPAAFARLLSERSIPVWIRYVLVPGYTDSESDLESAASFIKSMPNVQKVEVLPYHSMGSYKWTELGITYPLEGILPPDNTAINKATRILCTAVN